MCTVKGGKKWEQYLRGRVGNVSPHSPPQTPDLGGIWEGRRAAATLDALWSGWSEGRKERVGEKRPARAQDIGLVAPARLARQHCRVSACGATGRFMSSPTRRSAGSGRQHGHPVAPHALARQRLSVATGKLERPNGLLPANKNQYKLKLKYY